MKIFTSLRSHIKDYAWIYRIYRKVKPRNQRFTRKTIISTKAYQIERFSPSWVHRRLAADLVPKYSYQGQNVGEWQNEARVKLWELIGKLVVENSRLEEIVWRAEDERGCYEKIIIDGEYGSLIPIYKCIPSNWASPYSWVICLQGHNTGMHSSLGVDGSKEEWVEKAFKENDYVDWCFRNGFAAICLEQSCFGERSETVQSKRSGHWCFDTAMHSLILGRTLVGERLADIQRVIQFIQGQDIYSGGSIGVIGHSLGGTMSAYAAAMLDDIEFAIVASCVSSFDDSLLKIYHCADLYVPKLREWFEFGDVLALIAPKPLLIVQGEADPIFPVKGMDEAVSRVKNVYSALSANNNLRVMVGKKGHQFYRGLADKGIKEIQDSLRKKTG